MAEFQDIFCRPFLPSVLIIEGLGGIGSGAGLGGMQGVGGWGGRWQKEAPLGTLHEQP